MENAAQTDIDWNPDLNLGIKSTVLYSSPTFLHTFLRKLVGLTVKYASSLNATFTH